MGFNVMLKNYLLKNQTKETHFVFFNHPQKPFTVWLTDINVCFSGLSIDLGLFLAQMVHSLPGDWRLFHLK